MKTLLVIDMQEDFFRNNPLKDIRDELTRSINRLVKESRGRDVPVIWVRQEFQQDLSDAFLIMKKENIHITVTGTLGCQILSELDRLETELEVVKKRYSAFFQTDLHQHLKEIGTTELLLAGINTHACIRMAAIDAYQRDYDVIVPIECVASYDREHHDVTLSYIDCHIAKVVKLDDVWNESVLSKD